MALLGAFAARPAVSLADACTPPVTNPVACENTKPGDPASDWEVDGSGDPTIQGFATSMSVNAGGSISFKIKSSTADYHVDILRLGWYGGDGARLIASNLTPTNTTAQPSCQTFAATGLVDCGNWSVSLSYTVPSDAVSGVFIAHLVRNDTGGDSLIPFVVRNDSSHSAMVVQTSDETWEAYNDYGGNSLYTCTVQCPPGNPHAYKGASKVSYNRPWSTSGTDDGRSWLFSGAEYPMIRFLERNGYDVSYLSGVDVNTRGSLLLNHKVYISSGHDEYVSAAQRSAIEAARAAGVSLAFFSGNEMYWKTRFEPSADGSNTADRTLVAYKDTHYDQQMDPVTWTGTWRDPRFTSASVNTPENAVTGTSFTVNSGSAALTVPSTYSQLRLWRNTAVASLTSGQSLTLAPETLGYEWDVDADNGYRPAGEFDLSSTTVSGVEAFLDYGSTTEFGHTVTHNLTEYRAASGALVFGAGTVQWAFGLDSWNPNNSAADKTMEQATVNLFADMGAQPGTLQSDLVGASASTDTSAPTATITSAPSSASDGQQVTISGTASDTGGGVVAGVEVSTDGGSTWHPATGTTNWSYQWIAHGNPTTTIKVRAVDDSGNLQTPGPGTTVNVSCPCSLWGTATTVPSADRDSGDAGSIEVGVKFQSDKYGTVSGIRFYKASTNTGAHLGSLWTASGQRLAQATFSGETASGWQTVTFSSPVAIQPNATYVASYFAPGGHYSGTANYFYRAPAPGPNGGATIDSPPLHAVLNSGTTLNGVYSYGTSSTFPTNSFGASNYWVDVLFTPTAIPGQVTGASAVSGGKTSANVSWNAPATGGTVTQYRITPYVGSTAQTPTVVDAANGTTTSITGLTNGTTYTFRVEALNPNGAGPASDPSNAVTPLTAVAPSVPLNVAAMPATQQARVTWSPPQSDGDSPITGYTVTPFIGATAQTPTQVGASATSATVQGLTDGTSYTFRVTATNGAGTSPGAASNPVVPQATILDFATPTILDSGDTNPVELGVKFEADFNGSIVGLRFYKGAGNTGTHVGSLWSSAGQRLAQVTFTGESASGWQTANFSNAVPITAGSTYVASYFAPNGHYSADVDALTSGLDNPPLHAVSNASDANGVFAYSPTSTFPNSSYRASNYYVDVLYAVPVPGVPSSPSAVSSGGTSAIVSWTAPASGGPVASYRITPYVGSTPQTPTTVTGSPAPTSKKVVGLTTGTTYTFTVEALNANGSGGESAHSNAVTPTGPVAPLAPTGVSATPASSSALVGWTAPSSDGDSAITSYTITPYIGTQAQTPVQAGGSATSKVVTNLTNGVDYTFRVTANNAVGASPASAASSSIEPEDTLLDFGTPGVVDGGDTSAITVGVKFNTDFAGTVTGIRFYKGAANTGTHVGSLWTSAGTLLAQATFTDETASGWQTVLFSSPVALTPGTTYVASYFAPKGHYSVTSSAFASALDNSPLHALADSSSSNGLYSYGSPTAFPTGSFGASNYWVDVLFEPAPAPGTPTAVTATAGRTSATVTWTAPSSGGPPTSYTITPYVGSAAQNTVTASGSATSKTVTGLTPGTSYRFTVTASNPTGTGPESAASNAVTPTGAVAPGAPTGATAVGDAKSAVVSWTAPADDGGSAITGYTITPFIGSTAQTPVSVGGSATTARVTGLTNGTAYTFTVKATNAAGTGAASGATGAVTPRASILDLATPGSADGGDTSSVEVGVKFNSDVNGSITGIRFYKAAANTGSHVGSLWSASGTLLASGTFGNESASGWQTLTFNTPVPITAGTTYVAGYLAPNGHYSVTLNGFTSGVDNAPLHALADGTSRNGLYQYSASQVFPTSSFSASNYWVDVLFAPGS